VIFDGDGELDDEWGDYEGDGEEAEETCGSLDEDHVVTPFSFG